MISFTNAHKTCCFGVFLITYSTGVVFKDVVITVPEEDHSTEVNHKHTHLWVYECNQDCVFLTHQYMVSLISL